MNARAEELIKLLHLSAHPEGGYFAECYRSGDKVASPRNGEIRSAITEIYFLLISDRPSRFHKVIHDEIWHYYEGDPVEIIEISPDLSAVTRTILGNSAAAAIYSHCVKGDSWQAAYSKGDYSLAGCTVAPGFEFSDFKFLKDDEAALSGVRQKYPDLKYLI